MGWYKKQQIERFFQYGYRELNVDIDRFPAWAKVKPDPTTSDSPYGPHHRVVKYKMPPEIIDLSKNNPNPTTRGLRGGVYHMGSHKLGHWDYWLKKAGYFEAEIFYQFNNDVDYVFYVVWTRVGKDPFSKLLKSSL
jgi:hypothetical protein